MHSHYYWKLYQRLQSLSQGTKHLIPYKLQWLNGDGEVKVNKQVLIAFSIGKYCDEVLYDVVLMQGSHLLLGRPWQYDRRVMHDGVTNRYSFEMNGRPITLVSLKPKQIYEEQLKLKKEKMVENESLYIRVTLFVNKVLLGFNDDTILQFDTNFFFYSRRCFLLYRFKVESF